MKSARQQKIIEIIQSQSIETQEELAARLSDAGFSVTQATISRDIRELKLMKLSGENGRQRYTLIKHSREENEGSSNRLIRVLREGFVSAETAQNILVIKTVSGMAMAVAAAMDAIAFSEILGSIAGDDTIFCVTHTNEEAEYIREKLETYIRRDVSHM